MLKLLIEHSLLPHANLSPSKASWISFIFSRVALSFLYEFWTFNFIHIDRCRTLKVHNDTRMENRRLGRLKCQACCRKPKFGPACLALPCLVFAVTTFDLVFPPFRSPFAQGHLSSKRRWVEVYIADILKFSSDTSTDSSTSFRRV